jgi:S-DNA-T family DNA segregation ATPase FtsK/SpoIIIE
VTTTVYRRSGRRPPPALPKGELLFESPPELPEVTAAGALGKLLGFLPILAGGGSMAFMFSQGGSTSRLVMSGLMAVSMLGMSLGQTGNKKSDRKREIDAARRDYVRYLNQLRDRVRVAASRQREALVWRYPSPDALAAVALTGRLWERRPGDNDFAHVRIARGPQRFALKLIPPETKPIADLDPVCAGALRRFIRTYNTVAELPVSVGLRSFAQIGYDGDLAAIRANVRAIITHLAAFHSPDELIIAACVSPDRRGEWDWLKWLPHALHPDRQDAVGRLRLVTGSMAELDELLADDLAERGHFSPGTPSGDLRHLIVILDGGHVTDRSRLAARPAAATTIVDVQHVLGRSAGDAALALQIEDGTISLGERDQRGRRRWRPIGEPDAVAVGQADAFARSIAGLRAPERGAAAPVDDRAAEQQETFTELDLPSLLHLDDAGRLDLDTLWRRRSNRDKLRIPFGIDQHGRAVELDIKESAQGGMGPHGLVIGATGSGKSELLRTLVLGMVSTHSSDALNLVLVDFKGGATFLGMDELPHVSAVITNLEEELILVDRMQDAIAGEMNRRQELLRHAGNFANLRDYEAAREAGAPLDPLPSLWIVVDEFSELLSAKPEFIELFVMIGRLGRSLGVHLLLASQRLEEGRLRGLDTHLSYRIGLRTFSAGESRSVLGVPDAYELPPEPGHGYLKFATEPLEKFRAAYVGSTYTPSSAVAVVTELGESATRIPATVYVPQIAAYSTEFAEPKTATVITSASASGPRAPGSAGPLDDPLAATVSTDLDVALGTGPDGTMFDVMIAQMVGQGRPAHAVWLPPLDRSPSMDAVLPGLTEQPGLGLQPADWPIRGSLRAPIGIVDRPYEQRRDPLWLDLAGAGGQVGIVGSPQSGKSTLLRSLISGFALTHTPDQVQFYCLDFGGGALGGMTALPHVGGVAARLSPDAVRRTVGEMTTLLDARERAFADHGVDSIATYRRMRADGRVPADRFAPDIFLVVDGWTTLRAEYEPLELPIQNLAARGLGYGIHVVLTASRWMDFRGAVKDTLQTRLELKLGDPYDSEVDRKKAANVPAGRAGRGLTPEGLHFIGALPRIDGRDGTDDLADGVREMGARMSAAWDGPAAPAVRLLPDVLTEAELATIATTTAPAGGRALGAAAVPIGLDENELSPVWLDFVNEPHLVVVGDNESGKSNLLDLIARRVVADNTPAQARLVILDYRRALLDSVSGEQLIGYAASADAAQSVCRDVAAALRKRLPGPDVTPDQLRSRSWWKGPELYVFVDDYELVASSTGNPLAQLADLTSQAGDIGLHLVISRGFGGVGRAMYDPVVQRIRDMGSPALVMSGNKDEGALWGGVRGEPLPAGRGRLVSRRLGTRLVQTALGGTSTD